MDDIGAVGLHGETLEGTQTSVQVQTELLPGHFNIDGKQYATTAGNPRLWLEVDILIYNWHHNSHPEHTSRPINRA